MSDTKGNQNVGGSARGGEVRAARNWRCYYGGVITNPRNSRFKTHSVRKPFVRVSVGSGEKRGSQVSLPVIVESKTKVSPNGV